MPVRILTPPFALDQRVWAKFARQNKNNTLEEYRTECAKLGGYTWEQCRIVRLLALSGEEYDALAHSLLEPHEGFEDPGGTGSDSVQEPDDRFHFADEAQSYLNVGLVYAPGREPFVIDPQGFSYARYVGLDIRPHPPEVRNPGDPRGRWVLGPQNACGVVLDCLGRDCCGHMRYHAALLNAQRRPVAEETIVISSWWHWAFANPDSEKMSEEDLGRLRDGLQAALARERETKEKELRAAQEALEQLQSAFEKRRPPKARTVIIAEYQHQKGMFSSETLRTVFLAWSLHQQRHLFSELRKAAALFGPTAHLAVRRKDYEHRDGTYPGEGYYLSCGGYHAEGWKVRKIPADCPTAREAEWNPPEALPAPLDDGKKK